MVCPRPSRELGNLVCIFMKKHCRFSMLHSSISKLPFLSSFSSLHSVFQKKTSVASSPQFLGVQTKTFCTFLSLQDVHIASSKLSAKWEQRYSCPTIPLFGKIFYLISGTVPQLPCHHAGRVVWWWAQFIPDYLLSVGVLLKFKEKIFFLSEMKFPVLSCPLSKTWRASLFLHQLVSLFLGQREGNPWIRDWIEGVWKHFVF